MGFLSYLLGIVAIAVILLLIYFSNRQQVHENPIAFVIAIALFVGIIVLTNVLGKYVAPWLGITFFSVCAAGLLFYYIYRKVKG